MYRKFKADKIFNGNELLPASMVLITNKSGEIVDLVEGINAGSDVEEMEGILTAGFINCHCHLELSHLKGYIPKKTGLVDFVFKVVTERHFEEQEILFAIEKAEKDMLNGGIVAVGDICNNDLTIPQKTRRNIWYRNFIEVSGFPPAIAEMRFQRSVDFFNTYTKLFSNNSIVPHAAYSVSPKLFELINDFPGNNLLTIHNQEIIDENEFFKNKKGDLLRMFQKMNIDISFFDPSGKSSLQTYLPYLKKLQSLILVHNVDTSLEDIAFTNAIFKEQGSKAFYCLCPNANLYISDTLPDINKFIDQHSNIVLGTDSLASNDQLSILEEIKTINKNFPQVEIQTILGWATINGAEALGCDEIYGSFKIGKTPGIILIKNIVENNMSEAEAIRIL